MGIITMLGDIKHLMALSYLAWTSLEIKSFAEKRDIKKLQLGSWLALRVALEGWNIFVPGWTGQLSSLLVAGDLIYLFKNSSQFEN